MAIILDKILEKIQKFTEYMNNAPFEQGLWTFVKLILNKNINIKELQQKYKNTIRFFPKNI